ncbi:MAG TPA: SpoIID/LytB domain-containing protein [Coleofasciculaceae cyanobacterium]
MFGLPNKRLVLNRSVLWTVFLFSTALVLPVALAHSLNSRSQTVIAPSSPSVPSPASEPIIQPSPDNLVAAAEREWHRRLVSQGFSWQPNSTQVASAIASKSPESKTQTTSSKSPTPKAQTSSTQTPKTPAQGQKSSKTNNQQQRKTPPPATGKSQDLPASRNTPVIEMRVAIANGVNSLVVGSSTPAEVVDAKGKLLGKLSPNDGTNVQPNGSSLRIGQWQTPAGVWVKPTKGGLVFVGDRWYRGDLLLVSQGSTLLAVNYVDLEDYIASVVGAEVSPSWPMNALKAQAIAARSYALVHYIRPANSLYDLGNTQRWQVYRGVSAEWNTTRQATQETHGVFLSYKGGVVESMYAASDDIVTNVFGGRGMSQKGALSLAQQGYNYRQILNYYYPGTGLAWMDTQQHDTN